MSEVGRHPLGLPAGSVRAILTLATLFIVVLKLYRGEKVALFWSETLMIALAHYFSMRRFVHLTPELLERLRAEGAVEDDRRPLFLPKYTIRLIVILSFVGLTYFLYIEGRLWSNLYALTLIASAFFFFLGYFFNRLFSWLFKGKQLHLNWIDDIKALAVLLPVLILLVLTALDQLQLVPEAVRNFIALLILFYFGSR